MSTILIVDDDAAVRILLRTILERDHHVVHEAPEGGAALALLHEGKRFDAIIADVMMHGMSGHELLAELARIQPTRRNVVVLTAATGRNVAGLDQTCVNTIMRKPFELEELRNAVRAATTRRVLLVEDDVPTQYLIRRALQSIDYDLTIASDGPEALIALAEGNFDALVVDLRLPTISGYDVIDRVHSAPAAPPVVVLTVIDHPERPLPRIAAYLRKPDGIERLLPTLRAIA
ncbi:MAG TPA: response regulator [Thermoanaerobaculia bacterium]|nr:response regulator [Thermoanaerobaculia bacterium]